MPTLLPRKKMDATSVIPASIQRPSPSDHRVGSSNSFTRLRVGSLALRPALLLFGNSRPRVTATPLPHATGAHGQLLGRDFNPLDLLLLLRTARFEFISGELLHQPVRPACCAASIPALAKKPDRDSPARLAASSIRVSTLREIVMFTRSVVSSSRIKSSSTSAQTPPAYSGLLW